MSDQRTNTNLRSAIAHKLGRLIFLPLIAALVVGGGIGLAIAGSLATQVIIDFEGLGYSDYGYLGTGTITNNGFTVSNSSNDWETFTGGTGFCHNGSGGCVAVSDLPGHAETITIQMLTGDRFKFTSFWIGNHGAGGGVAKVEGFRNGSPTPVATLNSGFPANGDVSAVNALITLPTAFQDVDKVVITSNSSQGFYDVFDDFQFDTPVRVPILAASAATGITTTGATLNGIADDNTATSTISFDYGLTTAYGSNVAATTGGTVTAGSGGTAAAVNVSGLTCATTYHFRLSGTNSFGSSTSADASFSTSPCPQTITFSQPATQSFGTTPTLSASATSSLTVAFTSSTTGVCTITGGGALTFVTTGTCTINADQAGNASYGAAPQVSRSFTVAAVAPGAPTIGTAAAGNTQASVSFTAPGFTGGAGITGYTVTASPGGATGTGAGSPIVVTGLSNGTSYTFTVTATNTAGTGSASTASNAVTPIGAQTITFNPQGAQTFVSGGVFTINPLATSTSGLAISYSSLTSGTCTVSGINVNIVAAGTCTLAADQPGNAAFLAATQATQSISIGKANQSIAFGALSTKPLSSPPFTVSATATSSLAVAFTSTTTGICTVSGNTVTLVAVGTCTVAADQSGNANYNAAPQVTQSFGVGANVQTITFAAISPITLSNPAVALAASSTSGLPVSFSSQSPANCSVNGNVATAIAVGVCTIQATQAGNATFAAASPVSQSFNISAGTPSAPALAACIPGNHSTVCTFSAPAANGSPAPTSYTLSCQSGTSAAVQVAGAASPLSLTSLNNGQYYLCSVTAVNAVGSGPASNSVAITPFSKLAAGGSSDMNGDGKAEVVLRAANATSTASLNASNKLDITPIAGPGPEWRILGTGDFSGSHRSDLLIQNIASGDVHLWINFDGPPDGDIFLRNVKPGWVVEAIADLDGDGKSDIVWRFIGSPLNPPVNPDDAGVVFVWFMNGNVISEIKARGGAPLAWSLVGVTDLDGDGLGDLVWQSPTGTTRGIFSLSGRNFVNRLLGNVPTGYTMVKVLDFDADGNGDLLFRNAAGKVKLWRMNGSTLLAEVNLPDTDSTWVFYAATDLNGDGTGDIIWKKPNGSLVLWLMNASSPAAPTVVDPAGNAPAGFSVIE